MAGESIMAESNLIFREISPDKPYKRIFKDEGSRGRNPSAFFKSESTAKVIEAKVKREVSLSQVAIRDTYYKLLNDPTLRAELLIRLVVTANGENGGLEGAFYDFELTMRAIERRLEKINGRE